MEATIPKLAFEAPRVVALPVAGSDALFPVRRVYCIGRNYAAHAIEMGHDPDREAPFFFQKNPDNLDPSGRFPYPPKSSDVHHEVEMAVMLKSGGRNIPVEKALDCVFGYALSLDMTRRDLQGAQKKMGRPWEIGKAFEASAPVGPIHPVSEVGHLDQGRITLKVNGDLRQDGDLNQMIWKVPEQIAYLSDYYELAPGDVILSGTPAGVAAVDEGDVLEIAVEGLGKMTVKVV
ncbi:MAG: fumarylacetoacetate hydrolase family protein [Pseudomonadota bacterium]